MPKTCIELCQDNPIQPYTFLEKSYAKNLHRAMPKIYTLMIPLSQTTVLVMGYSTNFEGHFEITPPIDEKHASYINTYSNNRHMKLHNSWSQKPDKIRESVGLSFGNEGEFYTGEEKPKHRDVIDYNKPPSNVPSLWCQWIVEDNHLQWNGVEKFYCYISWLTYLIDNFFNKWGYMLNGTVVWQGEYEDDKGVIKLENNNITVICEQNYGYGTDPRH